MTERPIEKKPGRWRRARRWSLYSIGLTVSFSVGLVIRAARFPSRQDDSVQSVDVSIDAHQVAEALSDFLSVSSVSFEDRPKMDRDAFLSLHQVLVDHFPKSHETLHRETVNELGLLYRWQGRDERLEPMLLMSHMDVVPVESQTVDDWTHGAFSGDIEDGFVWGRGAIDVKSGVIGIMAGIERLVADGFQPERTVYLAFGHDEEVGGNDGNAVIAKKFADEGVRLSLVLDEGGAILDGIIPGCSEPVAFVALAEKRTLVLKLVAEGEGGHGSMPGRSAIVNLAEAITLLERHPMPARLTECTATMFDFLGPEMPWLQRTVVGNRWLFGKLITGQLAKSPSTNAVVRSTMSFTQLHTDSAENQNATVATATINARFLPDETVEDLARHVAEVTKNLRLNDGQPAISLRFPEEKISHLVSPVDCPEFERLQKTIHEVFPDVVVAAGLTSVSTDSHWYYQVTDKVYRFIPVRMTPSDMPRVHGTDERIGVENLAEIARFYVQFVRNQAGRE